MNGMAFSYLIKAGNRKERPFMEWCEIFRTGEHTDSSGKKRRWTREDLERMVSTYDPENGIEAPIVIDHQETGPAYGWVEELKVEGDRLLARFRQVEPTFRKMVNDGLFKKRSICVTKDGRLEHVAFLGALPPAVEGLKEYRFSHSNGCETYIFAKEKELDPEKKEENTQPKDFDKMLKAIEDLKARCEKLEKELEQSKEQLKKERHEFSSFRQETKRRELEAEVDSAIKDGRLMPSAKSDGIVDFMMNIDSDETYEFSGKKVGKLEWFRNFMFNRQPHSLFNSFNYGKRTLDAENSDAADKETVEMMVRSAGGER